MSGKIILLILLFALTVLRSWAAFEYNVVDYGAKSDSHFGVENLTVANCIMKSESNGIKFGTGSIGYF